MSKQNRFPPPIQSSSRSAEGNLAWGYLKDAIGEGSGRGGRHPTRDGDGAKPLSQQIFFFPEPHDCVDENVLSAKLNVRRSASFSADHARRAYLGELNDAIERLIRIPDRLIRFRRCEQEPVAGPLRAPDGERQAGSSLVRSKSRCIYSNTHRRHYGF
jgi:hypothetical protein